MADEFPTFDPDTGHFTSSLVEARIAALGAGGDSVVFSGDTEPDPDDYTIWADTTTEPPVLKGWDGSGWVAIGGGSGDLDADLDDIANLNPANNDVLQRKSGHWTNRTPSLFKSDLALVKGDVGLGSVDNTADVDKPISTATQTALNGKAASSHTHDWTTDVTGKPTIPAIYVGDTAPSSSSYLVWADTTALPPTLKGWTGLTWAAIGGGGGGDAGPFEAKHVVSVAGATQAIPSPVSATISDYTLSADCAFTLPSGFDSTQGTSITVIVHQPSTGGSYNHGVSFSGATLRWLGDTVPDQAVGQGALSTYTFATVDGGANWIGASSEIDAANNVAVVLVDAPVVEIDAALGNLFILTATSAVGNTRQLGNPTNLTEAKRLTFRLKQDSVGGRDFTLGSVFNSGSDVTLPIAWSTAANKRDYMVTAYDASAAKLDVVGYSRGY